MLDGAAYGSFVYGMCMACVRACSLRGGDGGVFCHRHSVVS